MKSIFKISGKKYEVDGQSIGKTKWSFDRRPGGWVIGTRVLENGTQHRIRFFHATSKQTIHTKIQGSPSIEFTGERLVSSRGSVAASGASDYTAQFPGKVRKISVKDGESVQAGTPLMMVEAMKMEFSIKAGSNGLVVKVRVEEGMQLTPGQVLLDFKEEP